VRDRLRDFAGLVVDGVVASCKLFCEQVLNEQEQEDEQASQYAT
jgi:hypothetical protein